MFVVFCYYNTKQSACKASFLTSRTVETCSQILNCVCVSVIHCSIILMNSLKIIVLRS